MNNNLSPQARLLSLDTLRGLDMLVILGLDALVYSLYSLNGGDFWQVCAQQMRHVEWEGLAAYDCVFPLFVFISGIALFLSTRKAEAEGRSAWKRLGKMWKRAAVLVFLGCLVNGDLSLNPESMRLASVLGLIGISGALAGSLVLLLRRTSALLAACLLLWGGVYLLQEHFGYGRDCANALIDQRFLPGLLYKGHYDPEGLLCLVSAGALALAGYLCGRLLLIPRAGKRLLCMAGAGLLCLAAGQIGPCIKNIWTPAFCLISSGIGFLLMAFFHALIDLTDKNGWTWPLRAVGSNALFIYVFVHVIPFGRLSQRIFGGCIEHFFPAAWSPCLEAGGYLLLAWAICAFLFRKRIFFRI